MKTCTLCGKVKPDEVFYRDGSWCPDCRATKRSQYYQTSQANKQALAMIHKRPGDEIDPTAYAKLHCEHIASYTKRAIEKFERKTGKEARPELTAIHQLASRLAAEQTAELTSRALKIHGTKVVPIPQPRECQHCGKTYTPKGAYRSKFCSRHCRHTFKHLLHPEYRARVEQRIREQGAPARAARHAERQARLNEKHLKQDTWSALQHELQARAEQARDMRLQGHRWQHIADTLGYSGPGAAHNAIRLRLGINPRTLMSSTPSATTTSAAIAGT